MKKLIIILLICTSCIDYEEKYPTVFHKGDKVCVMGKFSGIVNFSNVYGIPSRRLYHIDYVTPYKVEGDLFTEFQLSKGECK